MTIADKLNKLLSTKAAIKAAITGKGVAVADSDTFASYPAKIASITTGTVLEPLANPVTAPYLDSSKQAYNDQGQLIQGTGRGLKYLEYGVTVPYLTVAAAKEYSDGKLSTFQIYDTSFKFNGLQKITENDIKLSKLSNLKLTVKTKFSVFGCSSSLFSRSELSSHSILSNIFFNNPKAACVFDLYKHYIDYDDSTINRYITGKAQYDFNLPQDYFYAIGIQHKEGVQAQQLYYVFYEEN